MLIRFSGLMTPTPRSRSTDNLEKFSPSFTRKNTYDSSPLSRRLTGDSIVSQESSDGSLAAESCYDHSPGSTLSKGISPDGSKAGIITLWLYMFSVYFQFYFCFCAILALF